MNSLVVYLHATFATTNPKTRTQKTKSGSRRKRGLSHEASLGGVQVQCNTVCAGILTTNGLWGSYLALQDRNKVFVF